MAERTRELILDAAEATFAAKGYSATSIRDITNAAGVNVAAVHYHFGSKQGVLRGVTDRIVGPLNARRFHLLDASLRVADPSPIERLIEAFVRPDIESLQSLEERAPTVARFLATVYRDPSPAIREMAADQFADVRGRFFPAIARSLPGLAPDDISWLMRRATTIVIDLFAEWPQGGISADEAHRTIDWTVRFVSAGITACAEADPGG